MQTQDPRCQMADAQPLAAECLQDTTGATCSGGDADECKEQATAHCMVSRATGMAWVSTAIGHAAQSCWADACP